MNILFAAYFPLGYGGGEISMLHLGRALKKRGHKVVIASTGIYEGFKTYPLPKVRRLPYFLQQRILLSCFRKIVEKERIEIIHTHDRMTAAPAILAGKREKVRVVNHYRDYWFACPKSTCLKTDLTLCKGCEWSCMLKCSASPLRIPLDWYKMLHLKRIRKMLKEADVKIVNSLAVKNKLEGFGICGNIRIIHPPREAIKINLLKDERKKLKEEYGLKKKVIMLCGNLEMNKGFQVVVPILPKLMKEFKDLSALVVGDGALRKSLEEASGGAAVFTGKLDHAKTLRLFAVADMILLPSLWEEPFSGIILEAGWLGKPLIASRRGGIVDLPDKTYLPVDDPESKEEWCEKIASLIKNPSVAKKMVRKAKTIVVEHEPERIAKQVEQAYQEAMPTKEELVAFYGEAWENERADRLDEDLIPQDNSFRVRMEIAAGMVKQKEEETVILDLGCGIGLYDFYVLRKVPNARILGVDISQKQIQLATELSRKTAMDRISFKVMDVEKLRPEDLGGFKNPHYIIATEIMEHLVDPRAFLRKVRSLCSEKTRFIVSVPLVYFNEKGNVWYKQKRGEKAIETQDKAEINEGEKYYRFWHKEYTVPEILTVLDEEGFRVRRIHGGLFRPFRTKNAYVYTAMCKLTFSRHTDKFLNAMTGNKFARNITLKCSLK